MSRRSVRTLVSLAVATALAIAVPAVVPTAAHATEVALSGGGAVVYTPNHAYAYVARDADVVGSPVRDQIVRVNMTTLATETVATIVAPGGCLPDIQSLAITPDGTTLYAGAYACVYRLDLSANPITVTSQIIGWNISGLVASNDRVYAALAPSGQLYYTTKTLGGAWTDTWTQAYFGAVSTDGVEAISPDGSTLYIATNDYNLRSYDTTTFWPPTVISGQFEADAMVISPDGSFIIGVRGNTARKVMLTGPNAGTITSAQYAIWGANTVAIDPSGTYAYIGGHFDYHTITKIRTSDLGLEGTYTIGGGVNDQAPNGLAEPAPGVGVPDALIATLVDKLLMFPLLPGAPTLNSATPGDGQASVSFTPGSGGLSAISNYQYRIGGVNGTWTSLSPPTTTSPVTIPNLVNGTQVSIQLRAVAGSDVGDASSGVTVTPMTTPQAPTNLVATPGNGDASIAFTAGSDGGSPITNYKYQIDNVWYTLSPNDASSPVTIPGLTPQQAASIVLRAVNAVGESPDSAPVSVTPYGPASAPTNLLATPGNASTSIAFTPGFDGGSPITNYEYRLDGVLGTWTAFNPVVTTSPVAITGLTNGVAVGIELRAVTAAGPGAASASEAVTPSAPAPSFGGDATPVTPTPEATPVVTPAPEEPAPAPVPEAPALPQSVALEQRVPVGEGLVVVDGQQVVSRVKAVGGRSWLVAGDNFTLRFTPKSRTGQLDDTFSTKAGTALNIRGEGFQPGTLVAVYLPGSLPDSLGSTLVKDDGTFSVQATFPSSLKPGSYVLQVDGLASPTAVRSVNLGVRLEAAPRKAVSTKVSFRTGTAELTSDSEASIMRFLNRNQKMATTALVVPHVGVKVLADEPNLAHQRAQAVIALVKDSGLDVSTREADTVQEAVDSSADSLTRLWLRLADTSAN